eukprot:292160-Pelagomonas_calceolata.AAC.6
MAMRFAVAFNGSCSGGKCALCTTILFTPILTSRLMPQCKINAGPHGAGTSAFRGSVQAAARLTWILLCIAWIYGVGQSRRLRALLEFCCAVYGRQCNSSQSILMELNGIMLSAW